MGLATLVLEYVKVILSPHIIAGVVALILLGVFREDIKVLMRRIATIRLPGGSELSTSQVEKSKEELAPNPEQPPAPSGGSPHILQELQITQEQLGTLRQVFDAERARAALWEYRYLNLFFVRGTQMVLDWLATLPNPPTLFFFDSFWMPLIPSAEERRVIINVLETHHLIQFQGELVQVTPKGKEYLQWRGPLPSAKRE